MTDYQQHFGLDAPVGSPNTDADNAFVSDQLSSIAKKIGNAVALADPIITVTGPVGSGKTLAIHYALNQLEQDVRILDVGRVKWQADEVLEQILAELGVDADTAGTLKKIRLFRNELDRLFAEGTRVVVVVEDAERTGIPVLSELEVLLSTENATPVPLILCGNEDLDQLLRDEQLSRLEQRIECRLSLSPLAVDEMELFVQHVLKLAGGDAGSLLGKDFAALLHILSCGIPRVALKLIRATLENASSAGEGKVSCSRLATVARQDFGIMTELPVIEPARTEPQVAAADVEIDTPAQVEPEVTPTDSANSEPDLPEPPVLVQTSVHEQIEGSQVSVEQSEAAEAEDPEDSLQNDDIPHLIQDTQPELTVLSVNNDLEKDESDESDDAVTEAVEEQTDVAGPVDGKAATEEKIEEQTDVAGPVEVQAVAAEPIEEQTDVAGPVDVQAAVVEPVEVQTDVTESAVAEVQVAAESDIPELVAEEAPVLEPVATAEAATEIPTITATPISDDEPTATADEFDHEMLPDLDALTAELAAASQLVEALPTDPSDTGSHEEIAADDVAPIEAPAQEPERVEPKPEEDVAPPKPEELELSLADDNAPVVEAPDDGVAEWDRDPTLAQLKPDLDALELAMATTIEEVEAETTIEEPEPVAPVSQEAEPAPEEFLEITLDDSIQEKVDAEAEELSRQQAENSGDEAAADEELADGGRSSKMSDTEIHRMANELNNAESLEDMDDKLAETLFGDEINFVASQVLKEAREKAEQNKAEPPTAADGDNQEMVKEFEQVWGGKPTEDVSLESKPAKANAGLDMSASQRLATVRALNAEMGKPMAATPPAAAADPAPAPKNNAPVPESIEEQITTSMTATMKALKIDPEDLKQDEDEEEQKGGFFSRFRKKG